MKLGISTYAYSWSIGVPNNMPDHPMDAFMFIKSASNLGLNVVQIADNLPLHSLTIKERRHLLEYANKLGIAVEIGTRGLIPENLEEYIEIAKHFNSPILRIVIDTKEYKPDYQEIIYTIRNFLAKLKTSNVILAIENHDRFKSSMLRTIIESLNNSPYVGICLDTVNSFGALEGTDIVVENLGPYTVNLHLKDFIIKRVANQMGFKIEGASSGEGMLDIPWILDRLKKYHRNCNAILELWTPYEENINKTIEKENKWINKSIRYLKKYIP